MRPQSAEQLTGSFVGEEQPTAADLDHVVRAGKQVLQPVGPGKLEEHVPCPADD